MYVLCERAIIRLKDLRTTVSILINYKRRSLYYMSTTNKLGDKIDRGVSLIRCCAFTYFYTESVAAQRGPTHIMWEKCNAQRDRTCMIVSICGGEGHIEDGVI